jgi:crotonobetainyl-CoA:carnitine CoA-transferase CaiB-like acyl-CoA transferase
VEAPARYGERVGPERGDEWWPVIERWASTRSAREIYTQAQALGLPFGWVCSSSDLADAEQLRSRGFVVDATSFDGRGPAVRGPVRAPGLSWRSGTVGALEQEPAAAPPATAGQPERSPDSLSVRRMPRSHGRPRSPTSSSWTSGRSPPAQP